MFCSIIIPTVGRSSLLQSVKSVLQQKFPSDEFEIIVVNDSGEPLAPASWQESNQVKIIGTQRRERCFARNAGAAIAQGDYFCFLDDDDWLLPDTVGHFWSLAQQFPGTAWFYGGAIFVDRGGNSLGSLNQGKTGNCFVEVMTETWIPIQASLIKAEAFFEAGGFNPDFVGTEDLELLRQIALRHNLVNTSENVTCMQRGCDRNTETDYSVGWYAIAKGRDTLLTAPEALPRLLDSAGNSAYLHGLVLRNYKSALFFNLRRHHWLQATSHFITGIISHIKSINYMFTGDYWLAFRDSHPLYLSLIDDPSPDYDSVEDWLFS